MTTTLAMLKNLPETKAEVELFAQKTINMIRDGGADSINLSIQLKALEETVKKIRAGIKDIALEEAEKNGKSFDYGNAKIDVAMAGVKYDYSNCQDLQWNDLDKMEQSIKKDKKERETFLKSIKGQLKLVDKETGSIDTIFAPVKTGTETIKITLK